MCVFKSSGFFIRFSMMKMMCSLQTFYWQDLIFISLDEFIFILAFFFVGFR